LRHLGGGILCFLSEQIEEDRRLLCKTPRGYNIDNFFHLFPNAKLLILIRDGRDVVSSAVKGGRHRLLAFEWYAYTWAKGARPILEFMQGAGGDLRERCWKLIRFEDLVERPEAALRDLLPFLGIDVSTFDCNQIHKVPLIGSSFVRGGKDKVNWDPVEKPKGFQPVGRWKSWNYWRKMIFKMIAGRELIRFGYVESNHW
jgi:protein-tyrosine sulfotransferase